MVILNRKCIYVLLGFVATIMLSMLVPRPPIVANSIELLRPQGPKPSLYKPVAEKTYLLLKTGVEVAYERLPPHFNTTLRRFPHHTIYADASAQIGSVEIVDCLAFLPEHTLLEDGELSAYRARKENEVLHWNWGNSKVYVNHQATGWNLDKFKNVPAFAHAWTQNKDLDWYVMIDADSYLPVAVLEEVTREKNPDDILYFGKAVSSPVFAHGGSGIVLSRGAMRAIFGETDDSIKSALETMVGMTPGQCCGDALVALVYNEITKADPADTLQFTERGQFQGMRTMNVVFDINDQWCKAAGVFHGVKPWEVFMLDKWEQKCDDEQKEMRYYDYYRDFVLPYIRPEIEDWTAIEPPGTFELSRKWVEHDVESNDKNKCRTVCEEDSDCTMWVYTGGKSCVIYRNLFILGEAKNKYHGNWEEGQENVVGYMVDRIREKRTRQPCDGLTNELEHPSEREGWYFEKLKADKESGIDHQRVTNTPLHITPSSPTEMPSA